MVRAEQLLNLLRIEAERQRRRAAFFTLFPDVGSLRREQPLHFEDFREPNRKRHYIASRPEITTPGANRLPNI